MTQAQSAQITNKGKPQAVTATAEFKPFVKETDNGPIDMIEVLASCTLVSKVKNQYSLWWTLEGYDNSGLLLERANIGVQWEAGVSRLEVFPAPKFRLWVAEHPDIWTPISNVVTYP